MNLKRQPVVSDVTGETRMAMIRAMLAGERAPGKLVRLRHARCPHDADTIAQAFHGQWHEEHRLALAQAVALSDMGHAKIAAGDQQSVAQLATCAAGQDRKAPPPTR